jgi:hypothetical protein
MSKALEAPEGRRPGLAAVGAFAGVALALLLAACGTHALTSSATVARDGGQARQALLSPAERPPIVMVDLVAQRVTYGLASDAGAAPAPEVAGDEASGGHSVEQAASDPTASLLSVQLQDLYVPSFHGLGGATANTLQYRAAVPFKSGCLNHIARVTVPISVGYEHNSADDYVGPQDTLTATVKVLLPRGG